MNKRQHKKINRRLFYSFKTLKKLQNKLIHFKRGNSYD